MRVLVADDHSLFRDGVISLLEASDFQVVGQVGDGDEAVRETLRLQPDLVLLDISMINMSGLEALGKIKAESPGTRVVMLTVSDEDADLFAAVEAGADGYLLKSLSSDDFISSLQALEKGEMALTRQTASRLIEGLVVSKHQQSKQTKLLTERETDLLNLVAEGLSNKAIALKLSISENTVKYHLKKILRKLDVQNRTEAVSYAIHIGLIDPPAPD